VPHKADRVPEIMERGDELAHNVEPGRVRCAWPSLHPGTYRLEVSCEGVATAIVTIDDILIGEGECSDGRLALIDLRGRVRSLQIRATAADGTAIVSSDAFVLIRGDSERWYGFHLGLGVVTLAVPQEVDLMVIARHHKTAFVNCVADSRTIALEAAAKTSVVVRLPAPMPEGTILRLDVMPAFDLPKQAQLQLDNGRGMQLADFFSDTVDVDANGRATIEVRYPGTYSIGGSIGFARDAHDCADVR
jgi:hypothetical protein